MVTVSRIGRKMPLPSTRQVTHDLREMDARNMEAAGEHVAPLGLVEIDNVEVCDVEKSLVLLSVGWS